MVQEASGFGGKRWSGNEWLVAQGYQRHLLALGAADAKLGALIDHLEQLDMFDDSIVLVTADHGYSFEAGSRNRGHEGTVWGDTLAVPLILKLPHQREGVVSDDNVEAIDIVPTIADVLGIDLPWAVDGRSMLDASTSKRDRKTAFYDIKIEQLVKNASDAVKYAGLRRKLAIFGSRRTKPNGYFRIGPYGNLVDRRIAEFPLVNGQDEKLTIRFKES